MGWRETSTKYHNEIVDAIFSYKDVKLKRSEIIKILEQKLPDQSRGKINLIYPSDHCRNHTNEGACYCAKSSKAIFQRVGHGEYRVRRSLVKL